MRQTKTEGILSEAFPARVELIAALKEAAQGSEADPSRLRRASEQIKQTAKGYGLAPNRVIYESLGNLAFSISLLLEWRSAVLNAETDSVRFKTAATQRASMWCQSREAAEEKSGLLQVAKLIMDVEDISQVAAIAASLAAVPLPVGLYSVLQSDHARHFDAAPKAEKPRDQLTVAFLKFTIDGNPLEETHFVSPGEMHDLDIEVRVSRWPAGAKEMILQPVTAELAGAYKMPIFSIPAPNGAAPYLLHARGRVELSVPTSLNARPYEFKYLARFEPAAAEQPVETVGQRSLLLEGLDLARNPMTGYTHVDRKILDIRKALRTVPRMIQTEITDALSLTIPLCALAAQSVQDNSFREVISEAQFQNRVRQFLRSHATIGQKLEEHAHAAGGITDLSFHGIRLELKVERKNRLVLADCEVYAPQAASYAMASGKKLAVLCVLDVSAKTAPVFPIEDGIGYLIHKITETPVYILTILIQGNLARPSDFSR